MTRSGVATKWRSGEVEGSLRHSATPPLDLQELFQPIRQELVEVEQYLKQCLAQGEGLIGGVGSYVFESPGKLLRPALVLMSAHSGRFQCPLGGPAAGHQELITLAAAMELIHVATLIHDDVVDNATLRRKRPSVNQRWGDKVSVIIGDFFYATAFTALAQLRQPYLLEAVARTTETLSKGELWELERRFDVGLDEPGYFKIIEGKTAALIAASCELGAVLAGAPQPKSARLAQFGKCFGMTFQIVDDCLDLVGDEQVLGKAVGSDLGQGNLSLPIIYYLRTLSTAQRRSWAERFGQAKGIQQERFAKEVARGAKESGAIDQAYETARRFAEDAKQAVAPMSGFPMKGQLEALVDFAVARQI